MVKEDAEVAVAVEVADKPTEDKKEESKEVEADAKPAAAEEEKTTGEAMSAEEAETEILKMLEFYFGDSNFGWDRFMQSKVRQYTRDET